jgi:signal transduction histidine kinase
MPTFAVTEILGDPDDAILRLARSAGTWILLYGTWTCVTACLVLGGYPAGRIAASAAVFLGMLPPMMVVGLGSRRKGGHHVVGGALLWACATQNVLAAAVTGGLHSPQAPVMIMTFAPLYGRHGWSRRARPVLALFCGAVLWMALVPRAWSGPVLAEPWFTIAESVAMIGTVAVHARFMGALRASATQAARAALRARDELADQALSRARELEVVGSRLSHELKNPLAAIKALVQLAHRAASQPPVRQQLDVVQREVDRISAVLHSHLGFSRPFDRVDRVDVDLGALADSVLALLEVRATAAGVVLRRRGDGRGAVDPQRIRGALVNLVANAIEACPRGRHVEIAIEEDGATSRLTVSDTGVGMAPELVERLGTPFPTDERGAGLGVALARAAFEQHGGTLEYRSAPGQGTSAVGSVPRSHADSRLAAT